MYPALSRNRVRYFKLIQEILTQGSLTWYDDGQLALFATHTVTLPYASGTFQLRVGRNSRDTVVLMLSSDEAARTSAPSITDQTTKGPSGRGNVDASGDLIDRVSRVERMLLTLILEDVPCRESGRCVAALESALRRVYFQAESEPETLDH